MRLTRLVLLNLVIPAIVGIIVTNWATSPVCGWFICSYAGLAIFLVVCIVTALFLDGVIWITSLVMRRIRKREPEFIRANLDMDVFPEMETDRVGISIHNVFPQKITHLHVELADVFWIDENGTNSLKIDKGLPRHRFTDIESDEPESILSDETVRVNIAMINGHERLVLVPDDANNRKELAQNVHLWAQQTPSSDFKVQLEITGRIDDKPIKPVPFIAIIHFEHRSFVTATALSAGRKYITSREPFLAIRNETNEKNNKKSKTAH